VEKLGSACLNGNEVTVILRKWNDFNLGTEKSGIHSRAASL